MDEGKGTAFIILGIVAIIAIVGLVLLLTQKSTTGKLTTMTGCEAPNALVLGPPNQNAEFLNQYVTAGYTCEKSPGADAFGKESWCCSPPRNVPVNERYQGVPILGYD